MGVYIKGMEMPKKEMILILFPDGKVATEEYEIGAKAKAVEVSPHGRLIDADDVFHVLTSYYHHSTDFQHEALKESLARVSTIIEEEEGEE